MPEESALYITEFKFPADVTKIPQVRYQQRLGRMHGYNEGCRL